MPPKLCVPELLHQLVSEWLREARAVVLELLRGCRLRYCAPSVTLPVVRVGRKSDLASQCDLVHIDNNCDYQQTCSDSHIAA